MAGHEHLLKKAYLKPREVARVIDRPVRTVYYLLTIGKLPGCKMGGLWVVPTERLVKFLRQLETAALKAAYKNWQTGRSVLKGHRAAEVVEVSRAPRQSGRDSETGRRKQG